MNHYTHWLLSLLAIVVMACIATADEPQPGVVTRCRVVEVYDGDTVTVEIKRTVRVRLLDLWTPEVRTKDADEKRKGLAAKERMRELVEGKEVLLQIPEAKDGRIDKAFSFGRVLAWIWVDGKDVSEVMRSEGHGTKDKQ